MAFTMSALNMKVATPTGMFGSNCKPLKARKAAIVPKAKATVRAAAVSGDVPDMGKRNVMNLLLVGAIGLPATSLVGGYALFFVPPGYVARTSRALSRPFSGCRPGLGSALTGAG